MLQDHKIVARLQMPSAPEVLSRSDGRDLHVLGTPPLSHWGGKAWSKL
jgi:hypothetical protein